MLTLDSVPRLAISDNVNNMKLLTKEIFASRIKQYVQHDNYDAVKIAQYAFSCYSDYNIIDERLKKVVYEIMMMDADSCMEMDRNQLINYIENMLHIKIEYITNTHLNHLNDD